VGRGRESKLDEDEHGDRRHGPRDRRQATPYWSSLSQELDCCKAGHSRDPDPGLGGGHAGQHRKHSGNLHPAAHRRERVGIGPEVRASLAIDGQRRRAVEHRDAHRDPAGIAGDEAFELLPEAIEGRLLVRRRFGERGQRLDRVEKLGVERQTEYGHPGAEETHPTQDRSILT